MKMKSDILIATHVAEAHGPQHVLKDYLLSRGAGLAYVACPFDYSKITHARVTQYAQGREVFSRQGHPNRTPGVAGWIRDAWFVGSCGVRYLKPRGVFIGFNNLNTAVGIWLRRLGFCREVVYFVVDYSPQRFSHPWINYVYQRLARFSARRADHVWNVSERIREVSRRFGAREATNQVVPIGLDTEVLKVLPEDKIVRHRLVIVSALFESKGVQLAIDAMAHLPEAELVIIGTGPYEAELKRRAQQQGVAARVRFMGMLSRENLYAELAQGRVALAPYQTDPANYTYFADPAKPKEYLACGIPVVITRVPWIAEAIEKQPMGLAVEDTPTAVAAACRRLMTEDAFWRQCRQNALAFVQGLDWETIFSQALKSLRHWPPEGV
jgi:glycosyltransferase involved in cell wall biosynthesis